jgi:hypothetical protein
MDLKLQRASEEARRVAVPEKFDISILLIQEVGQRPPHRALELGPLSSTTFNNVLNADVCVAKVISAPAGRATGCSITTAVTIQAVAISIDMAIVHGGTVPDGSGTTILSRCAGRMTATSKSIRGLTPSS